MWAYSADEGMINAASLAQMKKGTRLVNCARGELLDEVRWWRHCSRVNWAARHWMCSAMSPERFSIHNAPNIILTPHIAGSTNEAQEAVGVQIAMQVREYLLKGVIQNAVNVPSVTFEEYEEMLPYIGLAERLGTFLAQSGENGVEEISIGYGGNISEWKTDLIRNAAVAARAEPDGA